MSALRPTSLPHRVLSAVCVTLVLALAAFAASPVAHHWLHASESSHSCQQHAKSAPAPSSAEHQCAVVLYAQGVDGLLSPITVCPPRATVRSYAPVVADEFRWLAPRYLHQPERGPPGRLIV